VEDGVHITAPVDDGHDSDFALCHAKDDPPGRQDDLPILADTLTPKLGHDAPSERSRPELLERLEDARLHSEGVRCVVVDEDEVNDPV